MIALLTITEGRIAEELELDGVTMVYVNLRYPLFSGGGKAIRRINSYYRHIARALMRKAKRELLPAAADEWRYSVENSLAFKPFELVMTYAITCNEGDVLSLYYDVYEYTGGAHGLTKRYGDTWRASTGWFLELSDFFPRGANYRRLLIDNAVKTATEQMSAGTHQYFDGYQKLMKKYFSPSKFYVLPGKIAIFYDQYAIAPYFEGIPVFEYEPASAGSGQ